MTLAASGQMSIGGTTANRSINVEFGRSATATTSMSQLYRGGAIVPSSNTGVPTSGTISLSNFYGASNRISLSYAFSATTANASLNVTTLSGYIVGGSTITITVNSGVYLYSTSTSNAGLTLTGGSSGDDITVINNGYIMGQGGTGASKNSAAVTGGTALSLGFNTTVDNTNGSAYIGGGGGGGGAGTSVVLSREYDGGGGGAGGGTGGAGSVDDGGPTYGGGGGGSVGGGGSRGAGPGGGNGGGAGGEGGGSGGGGGGGRIFPGSGGEGGGNGAAGGGGNGNGTSPGDGHSGCGGGGWGASGGNGNWRGGAAGGKAVALNGYSITWTSGNTSRVYGSVS